MKLLMCSFYQAITLPTQGSANHNSVSKSNVPGVNLELVDYNIIVSHKDWEFDVVVPTANVRYATRSKEIVMTFTEPSPTIAKNATVQAKVKKAAPTYKTK